MSGMRPDVIRDRIHIDELPPGELLRQGKAGFCVVVRRCFRAGKDPAAVLKLQGDGGEIGFLASSTVPMRALLDEEVVPRTPECGDAPRQVLRALIRELSTGIRSWHD